MPLFLRLLRHQRGAWISFVSIYALGLSVFLVVNGLAKNFQEEIRLKSKELLEGDLRINARRPLTAAEQRKVDSLLPAGARKAEVWGFLSMLRTKTGAAQQGNREVTPAQPSQAAQPTEQGMSRLVQVKAISPEYPLVGAFAFANQTRIQDFKRGEIIFPHELFSALHVRVGDTVRLGNKDFVIRDEYVQRPGGNFEFWEMGSRVYIPLADMPATGLEQKGSRIFRYQFYLMPAGADLNALRLRLEAVLSDPEVEVTVFTDAGSDLGRSFQIVVAFLKMLSLSAFLLSAIGAAFFFRHHLLGERRTVAILTTLGASRRSVVRLYVLQNLFLSAAAAVTGMLLARIWSEGLPVLIERLYQIQIPSSLPFSTFVTGLILAVCTSLLFGFSGFAGLGKIPPAVLLKPIEQAPLRTAARAGLFLAQGAFFFALALIDSRSWLLSALSVGSMGASFLLLGLLGWLSFRVLWMLRSRFGYALRIVLGSIKWGRERSMLAFAALGFVAFTSCLVPELQHLILNEIKVPKGRTIPQLFLFDIQEEQLPALQDLLKAQGRALDSPSPMIRARLEKVNGAAFKRDAGGKKTIEERNKQQYRNRGFNLSFRDTLSDAETLVEGKWWKGPVAKGADSGSANGTEGYAQATPLPEISLEKDFAKRLDLKLGDTLLFDVQSVEIAGRVTSMRRVRWTTFLPNFFVLFQPGALEDAPKSYLGTLRQVPLDSAEDIQNRVSAAFPNVTILNLKDVIGKTVETLGKLEWLVRFLSGFALLIGLAILWLIVEAMTAENLRVTLLLRALGEPRAKLARQALLHYGGFCLAAGMTGYGLSLAAAWVIDKVVWQVPWVPEIRILSACFGASAFIGLACAVYAAYRGAGRPLRGLLALTRA